MDPAQLETFRAEQNHKLGGNILGSRKNDMGEYLYITTDGKKCKVYWKTIDIVTDAAGQRNITLRLSAYRDRVRAPPRENAYLVRAAYAHAVHAILDVNLSRFAEISFTDIDPYLEQVLNGSPVAELDVTQWRTQYGALASRKLEATPGYIGHDDPSLAQVNANYRAHPVALQAFDPLRNRGGGGVSGGGGGGGSWPWWDKPSWWDDAVDGPWVDHPFWGRVWRWRSWWGRPPFWRKSWTVTYGPGSRAHTAALTKADRSLRNKIARAIDSGKVKGRVVVLGKAGTTKTTQALKDSFPGVPIHVRRWGPSADEFLRSGLRKSNYVITHNPQRASGASRERLRSSRSRGTRITSSGRRREFFDGDIGEQDDYPPLTRLDEAFEDDLY